MQLKDYIYNQLKSGRCYFSLAKAAAKLGKSNEALRSAVAHLLSNREVLSPAKGFYLIVPPEYQILGCLPAEHFIPYLINYWGLEYYAGLLTAAKYHGAAHQSPHTFQVMIPKHKREIVCGKVKIKFYMNKYLNNTPTQKITTSKSTLIVSTPEGTAMDLMNYSKQSGGLNHIATILSELQDAMNPEKLHQLAENQKDLAWKQRLGYLLEKVNAIELAEVLKSNLKHQKKLDYIPLLTGTKDNINVTKNVTWKILENTTIEEDDL